jgi:transcriptional regulator with XRE-family HTH domain
MGHIPLCQGVISPLLRPTGSWEISHMRGEISPRAIPFAREIHRRMVAAGLNQAELARRAGLGITYVRDLFRGKSRNPRIDHALKLAGVFEASLTELGFVNTATPSAGEIVKDPDKLALLAFWDTIRELEPVRTIFFNALQDAAAKAATARDAAKVVQPDHVVSIPASHSKSSRKRTRAEVGSKAKKQQ